MVKQHISFIPYSFRYKYITLGTGFGGRNAGTCYPGGGVYLRHMQSERTYNQKERGNCKFMGYCRREINLTYRSTYHNRN